MEIKAVCVLKDQHDIYPYVHDLPDPVSGVSGVVVFESRANGQVLIKGTFTGLPRGKHGLHVCTFGNLFNGYHSIGPHFNPRKKIHGGQQDNERHVGDLGNIEANEDGVAEFQIEDQLISLSGIESIIGRAMVIQAEEDDLGKGENEESLISGNATTGLAWGVIGIADVTAN
ncbi:superoxide dismutase [Cu-Zn]-like isoform X2 [Stegostoma tigrinum]|uniref:superoxide dismutase [Cu-Zn]-like isoform X2 n=1 Tax=Stegostoma tigrinum TaxID=3053191 RepID=UPI00202B2387|nr:superoxide dismutase [Cu-Zn]-like isoform X2 [Stegostoma tigrinum]